MKGTEVCLYLNNKASVWLRYERQTSAAAKQELQHGRMTNGWKQSNQLERKYLECSTECAECLLYIHLMSTLPWFSTYEMNVRAYNSQLDNRQ